MKSISLREIGTMRTLQIASLGVALLCAPPVWANLIQNGSFETPLVPISGASTFGAGSSAITGWTVVGFDVAVISGTFAQSGIAFQAKDGVQWADLSGTASNSKSNGLTQQVATTAGSVYELNFNVGSATDNSLFFAATADLSINGGARTPYANPTAPTNMLDWKPFTVQFTATSAHTNITFFNGSEGTNFSTGLDNVSLTQLTAAVPEPESYAMMGTGLALIGWVARRRRKWHNSAGL